MSPAFKRVAILGVGLIGGSLGMALCSRGLASEVVGAGSSLENLQLAVELGAIHRYTTSPADSVSGAEIVVIATPVSAAIPFLQKVLSHLDPGTVITDVGSTRVGIVLEAERTIVSSISFVGDHPMAGSELTGVRGADPYLFENAFYNNYSYRQAIIMRKINGNHGIWRKILGVVEIYDCFRFLEEEAFYHDYQTL